MFLNSNFHTRLAIVTENELGLAFPPRNLSKKIRPDPSTIYLGIVVTNKQTGRQTNAGKNIIPRFRADNKYRLHDSYDGRVLTFALTTFASIGLGVGAGSAAAPSTPLRSVLLMLQH